MVITNQIDEVILQRLVRVYEHAKEQGVIATAEKVGFFIWSWVLTKGMRIETQLVGSSSLPTMIHVNPRDVQYGLDIPRSILQTVGKNALIGVCGGPWDKYRSDFTATPVYRSLTARFNHNADWKETSLYRQAVNQLEQGQQAWNGCQSIKDVERRCCELDELYENMRKSGYVPQQKLRERYRDEVAVSEPKTKRIGDRRFPDELRIAIGRNGELIRCGGGRHRLSIAQILGVPQIPVIVMIRHKDWHNLRSDITRFDDVNQLTARQRRHLSHPDIRAVVSEDLYHDDCVA